MIFYVLFLLFILLTTAGKSNSMTIVTFSVSGTEIVGSISGYATHTSLNSTNIKIECKNADNSKCDPVTEVTTKFPRDRHHISELHRYYFPSGTH